MKQDFLDYIQNQFQLSPDEIHAFSSSLNTPLKKSIRVNTNSISIESFKELAEKNNWTLTHTHLGSNTFYIDRADPSIPLGHTAEHISGRFYVQELAASSSPFYMSGDAIDTNPYTLLDMSASPGGKTTQLCEYYPNSLIVANELDRSRLKGLFSNLDRMHALNSIVTHYDGRHFKQTPEIFDKILLDAPCSGEGTGYKTDDALKYWNIKNIKRIAKLQFGLLEAAIIACKPGGEIVYSTCTLNTIENEQVIEKALKKYADVIEIVPLGERGDETMIRCWPHLHKTGGFFVAKIKKTASLGQESNAKTPLQNITKISSKETRMIEEFFVSQFGWNISSYSLYRYHGDIMMTSQNLDHVWDRLFLYKIGVNIGTLKDGVFHPHFFSGTLSVFEKNTLPYSGDDLATLMKGYELPSDQADGYYQITGDHNLPLGIAKVSSGQIKMMLPSNMVRK